MTMLGAIWSKEDKIFNYFYLITIKLAVIKDLRSVKVQNSEFRKIGLLVNPPSSFHFFYVEDVFISLYVLLKSASLLIKYIKE